MPKLTPSSSQVHFSKLDRLDRLSYLVEIGLLTKNDSDYLKTNVDLNLINLADKFIENTIGCFPIPLGLAANFVIDKKTYYIPMAVEETSIIAAASRTAKWIAESGEISTEVVGSTIIGQIQLAKIKDFIAFNKILEQHKHELINLANKEIVPNLAARGGGVKNIIVRAIQREDSYYMGILHVLMDTCDAMGANLINQVCEYLKGPIQNLTGEKVNICIVSNLADTKLTIAKVILHNIDLELGEKIMEASIFSQLDPYRAATNNKGVLNGIDPVLIATGNDWRAVEAGVHAYAASSGQYRSITQWKMQNKDLIGEFKAPLIVGTVGGVTRLHPMAQLSLRILGISQANELSCIAAAVGLTQNLGALRALTSEGIVSGHMKLHIKNLLIAANATAEETQLVQRKIEDYLKNNHKITLTDVKHFLEESHNIKT